VLTVLLIVHYYRSRRGAKAILNRLRDEINANYGYIGGKPRINKGPCGRFAKAFREEWNTRFSKKINIAFVMSRDGSICYHVLVKLPDGRYFDGGNGVMSRWRLLMRFPLASSVEEMVEFDPYLLSYRTNGLNRDYPYCPNYSDCTTAMIIKKHLALLAKKSDEF